MYIVPICILNRQYTYTVKLLYKKKYTNVITAFICDYPQINYLIRNTVKRALCGIAWDLKNFHFRHVSISLSKKENSVFYSNNFLHD